MSQLFLLTPPRSTVIPIENPMELDGNKLWCYGKTASNFNLTGNNVDNWLDISGQGNNLTSPGGEMPAQWNALSEVINGHPAVMYGDPMATKNSLQVSGWTYFIVMKAPASGTHIILSAGEGGSFELAIDCDNARLQVSNLEASQEASYGAGIPGVTTAHAYCFACDDGANTPLFYCDNRLLEASGFNEINGSIDVVGGSGGGASSLCSVADIFAYNRLLSDEERARTFAYCRREWGTP